MSWPVLTFRGQGFVLAQGALCWPLLSPTGCQPWRREWGQNPALPHSPIRCLRGRTASHTGPFPVFPSLRSRPVGSQAGGAAVFSCLKFYVRFLRRLGAQLCPRRHCGPCVGTAFECRVRPLEAARQGCPSLLAGG